MKDIFMHTIYLEAGRRFAHRKIYIIELIIALGILLVLYAPIKYAVQPSPNNEETLVFLQQGGYTQEFYPYFTVEMRGKHGTVTANFEEDKIASLTVCYPDKNGTLTQSFYKDWRITKCRTFDVDWAQQPLHDIYGILVKEYGFTEYKVYKTN